jgi:hypothetical protein
LKKSKNLSVRSTNAIQLGQAARRLRTVKNIRTKANYLHPFWRSTNYKKCHFWIVKTFSCNEKYTVFVVKNVINIYVCISILGKPFRSNFIYRCYHQP